MRERLQRSLRDLLGPLRPHTALGRDKVRIGSSHDGGYIMLDDFAGIQSLIGCGVGWDVNFEFELAEKGMAVDLFDHTVDKTPRAHPRFRFHRRKISGVAEDGVDSIDLDGIAREFAAPDGSALLKVDIEGDEWPLFERASRAALGRYRQIVCEVHDIHNISQPPFLATALGAVRNLTRDFAVVHVHANNHGAMLSFGDGLLVPAVLEFTFASRRHYRLKPSAETFPTPLDTPNNSKELDIWLGEFDFGDKPAPSPWWRRLWSGGKKT